MPVEKIFALLQMANIDSMDDIQNLLNGTIEWPGVLTG